MDIVKFCQHPFCFSIVLNFNWVLLIFLINIFSCGVHMCPRILLVLLTLLLFVQNSFSGISVRVFSRDEALYENNISKPRLYIENIGTEPISNFYCYYYFTKETGKTPVLEDYHTPSSSVSMTGIGNESVSNTTLQV